jgi:ring-1,2-phenylacetyl-CoA epoxidase subunit PaaC
MHARAFLQQLGRANADANQRIQAALDEAYPLAFSIFEPTIHSETLDREGIQPHEDALMKEWREEVEPFLRSCSLLLPDPGDISEHFGGRGGRHTPHLAPLIAEMTEVFAIDPEAKW